VTATAAPDRPPAWAVLSAALTTRRPVKARYHGQERILSPHALGWKNGRAKLLAYQADVAATGSTDSRQQWRSMFIDEIEGPTICDHPWQTADNYTPHHNGIDQLDLAVDI
jgi:predicted DNA-binding transcriptional regulator YafY